MYYVTDITIGLHHALMHVIAILIGQYTRGVAFFMRKTFICIISQGKGEYLIHTAELVDAEITLAFEDDGPNQK